MLAVETLHNDKKHKNWSKIVYYLIVAEIKFENSNYLFFLAIATV